ncbi:mandelate racemase/muconate lactonizing enzyme family protein [Paraburkholderia sp. Ac-20342]|uniref:mandelate racemase/muconate lactonizing enzyme family protein n=1 Tax=Paraburkholderia sp. Ac-20342 TaxID=2703889 RepID=UPI00197DAF49|nr:mandelate racemase/muconate lactonizing enzyme family protein [Paraburkholderia sp. Ac-20342]MBN3846297.1 mandelate racemase/muconate lactonizing enzyme family protein [Paraburkholderia sp. Ac-20342]
MKITDLKIRELSAELPLSFSGGTYKLDRRSTLLCRITTDEGVVGEVCVGNETGYSEHLKDVIRGKLRDLIMGQNPLDIERHWHNMLATTKEYADRASLMQGIALIDTALWDLRGKFLKQPLWRLLGGYRNSVQMIGIGGYYQTSKDEKGIREEIAFYKEYGLAGIKFKVGALSLEEDAERVRIVRAAGGNDFVIVVDSNMAWNPDDAERFASMIKPLKPAWLEEPICSEDIPLELHRLRQKSYVKTAAGQSELSVFEAHRLLVSESVDVLNVTYNRGGGVTGWVKIAAAASFSNVDMAQVGEPHIGMHLIASVPNTTYVECYPDEKRDPFWAKLYSNLPRPENGFIKLTEEPGVGLSLREDAVELFATEAWS